MREKYRLATVVVCCLLAAGFGCSQPEAMKNPKRPLTNTAGTPQTQPGTEAPAANAEAKPAESRAVDRIPVNTSVVKEVEAVKTPQPSSPHPALLDPSLATETAPPVFKATFETTQGEFVVEVTREWAPKGADRFYNLVKVGYFNNTAFFRNVEDFMVQFGISGDAELNAKWNRARIKDDPVLKSNLDGFITFATGGPNSRTTQVFINFVDNSRLDPMGFAPFGNVIEGMAVVKSLYNGYGEAYPRGKGPSQSNIQLQGNTYLKKKFPLLDYVKSATIVMD